MHAKYQILIKFWFLLQLLLLLLYTRLRGSLVTAKTLQKTELQGGKYSMDCRERGSHARDVSPAQYTSHMETSRVKEEEGADTRIMVKE